MNQPTNCLTKFYYLSHASAENSFATFTAEAFKLQ